MDRQFPKLGRAVWLVIIVSALGYFVDVYDLIILSVVRVNSLASLGVPHDKLLQYGINLLDLQLTGVVVGGFGWGIVGDKFGRLSVLFGSITLYSFANLLNAHISSFGQYEVLRVISGIGLAGELGAGITIVCEVMPKEIRGLGTMLIAAVGLLGAVVASICGLKLDWRNCYLVGGLLGFGLLWLRVGVAESRLFKEARLLAPKRGDIARILKHWPLLRKYLLSIAAGLPLYFVIGILITASPEVGKALGLSKAPDAAMSVMFCYGGMSLGDVLCSALSQLIKSRRFAIIFFHILTGAAIVLYLFFASSSTVGFYVRCGLLGFGIGFWATVVTNAAEQFGTDLRASAATTVPNLIRAALIPITAVFHPLRARVSLVGTCSIIGFSCVILAVFACLLMDETFGRDLNFVEPADATGE